MLMLGLRSVGISVGGLDRSSFSDSLLQFTSLGQMFDWGEYRDELADSSMPRDEYRLELRMASVVQRRENPMLNTLLQFIAARGWGSDSLTVLQSMRSNFGTQGHGTRMHS